MTVPSSQPPVTPLAKAGRAFVNFSLALAMIILASLIGVGGAAFFIYKQMGNSLSVAKAPASKTHSAVNPEAARPDLTPLSGIEPEGTRTAAATVSDASEWHFAEFSDQPRYIDVTYDNGRQHARLKVNTVLSSKPAAVAASAVSDAASSTVSDADASDEDNGGAPPLSDPGSRYIRDKETGRIIGIDGRAGAAMEVRRAEAVNPPPVLTNTIRNPVPEVRVASPVMQFGRPVFDGDRPVQAAIPVSPYLPTRKAFPVVPDQSEPGSGFDVSNELSSDNIPVRRATPVRQGANALPGDNRFPTSDRTYVFRRD